jgi:hypothetical protein
MLDCRNYNTLLHQGRCVGDVRNVLDRGFNREVLEVNSMENDSVTHSRWQDSEVHGSAGVKANSGKRDGCCQSMLELQEQPPNNYRFSHRCTLISIWGSKSVRGRSKVS